MAPSAMRQNSFHVVPFLIRDVRHRDRGELGGESDLYLQTKRRKSVRIPLHTSANPDDFCKVATIANGNALPKALIVSIASRK